MANATEIGCRLCLLTPPGDRLRDLLSLLSEAVAAGDVASVIFMVGADGDPGGDPAGDPAGDQALGAAVELVQKSGAAAILFGTPSASLSVDGVHVGNNPDEIRTAMASQKPDRIVGVGDLRSRHEAMTASEFEPDYLFFGQLNGDPDPMIDEAALDLARWWSSIAVVPGIVMGGSSVESVDQAATNGIDFVALGSAVWDDPRGPRAAVTEANRRLRSLETAA
jgi:thiamine-phosphate pyrophosphorylase